jgi:hypothetical protein
LRDTVEQRLAPGPDGRGLDRGEGELTEVRGDMQGEEVLIPLPGARGKLALGDPADAVVAEHDLARLRGCPLPLDDVALDER